MQGAPRTCPSRAQCREGEPALSRTRPSAVLGQFPSPYFSNHFTARLACGCGSHGHSNHFTARLALTAAGGNGHVTRSPATLNVQRVRWVKLAPSCLVWLAT